MGDQFDFGTTPAQQAVVVLLCFPVFRHLRYHLKTDVNHGKINEGAGTRTQDQRIKSPFGSLFFTPCFAGFRVFVL